MVELHGVNGTKFTTINNFGTWRKPRFHRHSIRHRVVKRKPPAAIVRRVAPSRGIPAPAVVVAPVAADPEVKPSLELVAIARRYLGTNPTGWRRLWCARFMAMIAPRLAMRVRNPNWARDWASLPKVTPQVGAIVVLKRGKGGHIGVVSKFDKRGNPIVISGNHNRRVAEARYSKHRVLAYVSPTG